MECYARKCKNSATNIVEKSADLAHKKARYCDECSKPYRQYPEDFKITKLYFCRKGESKNG